MPDEATPLCVVDADAWRAWLREHHAQTAGVWLVVAKKGATSPTRLTYGEALLEALCHGWIDGRVRGGDATSYFTRFTPRRARSPWSQRNVAIVEELIAAGRMHPAGLAAVERARADGRWVGEAGGARRG